jgi:hypothetical protein
MSALSMIRHWRRRVREDLLPELHGHRAKALADLSFALALARHCHSGKVAAVAPGDTTPAATKRRHERLLANDRLDPEAAWPQLTRVLLADRAGTTVTLILDETPNHNDLRCLKLALAYRRRALVIASICYAPGRQGGPMPAVVRRLLKQAAASLPEGVAVTLLADRGLAWPQVVDTCGQLGWHYVIRLQSGTRVRSADGSERPAAELAMHPGACWSGDAEIFKKSGWRAARVAACWEPGQKGPWLLASDRPEATRLFRRYARRTWTEELFRDEKSSGLHWEESHVKDPQHAARLVLLMALATYLALAIGSRVIKAGLRRLLESGRHRTLSLFQIGLRFLTFCATHERPLPRNLSPVPP